MKSVPIYGFTKCCDDGCKFSICVYCGIWADQLMWSSIMQCLNVTDGVHCILPIWTAILNIKCKHSTLNSCGWPSFSCTGPAWEYHMGYHTYDHSIFNIKVDLTSLKDFALKIEWSYPWHLMWYPHAVVSPAWPLDWIDLVSYKTNSVQFNFIDMT